MSQLTIEPNIADMDAFYEHLIETHNGLTETDSQLVNAKLVLLLANHIGDMEVLKDAFAKARADISAAERLVEQAH